MNAIVLALLLAVSSVWGAQVIDLGSQEIQGHFRGPELQLFDSDQLSEETASRILYSSLKQLEERLLKSEPAPLDPPRKEKDK